MSRDRISQTFSNSLDFVFCGKYTPVKHRYLFALLFSTLLASSVCAQNDPAGARSAGMAHAGLTYTDIWSLFHNPAGSAHIDAFTAGAFYESRFLIDELAYTGIGAAMPLGNGAIGIKYANFGYSVYREGHFGATYAMRLTDRLDAGVGLNYHTVRISQEDYGQTGVLAAEVGLRMEVSERVFAAVHVTNVTRSQLNDYGDERLPTLLSVGLAYQVGDDVLMTGEVVKDIDHDASLRGGIEYRPAEILYLRLGASSAPQQFAFGLGLRFDAFQFDLATTYGSVLGYSPQVSLTYRPGEK